MALSFLIIIPFNTENNEAKRAEKIPKIIPYKYSNSALKIIDTPAITTKPKTTS